MAWTFSFELGGRRSLVRTTLAGFFSVADVQRYERERNRVLVLLGCAPNRHLTLCDVSRCQLSTPGVVAELQRVIGDARYRSRRCAMVVPGALARLQARHAVQREGVAMLDSLAEAESWLFAPDSSPDICPDIWSHGRVNPLATYAALG